MKHISKIGCLLCLLWLAGTSVAMADVIRLKSGKTVEGTILFENEEVVVIRDASGARYQYPKTEVVDNSTGEEQPVSEESKSQDKASKAEQPTTDTGRKVSMGISLFGGGMAMPGQTVGDAPATQMGGHAGADVMVGTSNLFQRRIFLGGATGYHAYMTGGDVLSFIPVMLRAEVPLTLKRHAPMLGMGVGYGIGLQHILGGLCADVEFGWRYAYSRKGAFFMGVFADFQGAKVTVTETVSDKDYTSEAYRNLCGFGAKMALYF